ncbi:MAG: hypothetical protein ACE5NA_00550 [Nitrospiraceae bacterium]
MKTSTHTSIPEHIEITETLLRLYVFLVQYVDRCLDESARETYPERDFRDHLRATRSQLGEILARNRVVKDKVNQESERLLALGEICGAAGGKQVAELDALKSERIALQHKMNALSDLLAVFRAV